MQKGYCLLPLLLGFLQAHVQITTPGPFSQSCSLITLSLDGVVAGAFCPHGQDLAFVLIGFYKVLVFPFLQLVQVLQGSGPAFHLFNQCETVVQYFQLCTTVVLCNDIEY